jgi:glycosyltransferase involved in cell wall biosynthesis
MTNAIPKISVIIPVHNAAKYIEKTCNRILSELGSSDLELILIENGSTDNSYQLINALRQVNQAHANAEIIVLQSEPGLGKALYSGARVSWGKLSG